MCLLLTWISSWDRPLRGSIKSCGKSKEVWNGKPSVGDWRRTNPQIHRCREGFKKEEVRRTVACGREQGEREQMDFKIFFFMLWWDCTGKLDNGMRNLHRRGSQHCSTWQNVQIIFVKSEKVIESLLMVSQTSILWNIKLWGSSLPLSLVFTFLVSHPS